MLSPILFNLYSEMLINEALCEIEGVKLNGIDIKTIRYADDTAVVAPSQVVLQRMMDRITRKCEEYGMSLNTKKTMVMKVTKDVQDATTAPLSITVNDKKLKQVKEYKYLGSFVLDDMRCLDDVKRRIGLGKTAFWKCKELLRRDVSIELRRRMLDCYVKSVVSYGCEAWTFSETVRKKIDAFQIWCYRRMLKIKYFDHVTNNKLKKL